MCGRVTKRNILSSILLTLNFSLSFGPSLRQRSGDMIVIPFQILFQVSS